MEAACRETVATCAVSDVEFTAHTNTGLTSASFKVQVPEEMTEEQRRGIYGGVRDAAATLVNGEEMIQTSFMLGKGPRQYLISNLISNLLNLYGAQSTRYAL